MAVQRRVTAGHSSQGDNWVTAFTFNQSVQHENHRFWLSLTTHTMSLVQGYSSGEDETIDPNDAFGLSSLPAAKKPRTDELQSLKAEAAPHVLAEVSRDPSTRARGPLIS